MLGSGRVRANQEESVISNRPVTRPDLLAIHDEEVAVVVGARAEAREVRAGWAQSKADTRSRPP